MNGLSLPRFARRRGLTLVELVVVMAILVALAGIIIPILPDIIGRAETSARATNDSELFKWIQTYEATTSQYPYDWDSLIDSSTNAMPTYVGGSTSSTPPYALTTLTSNQIAALTGAGINSLQYMSNSGKTTLSTVPGATGLNAYSNTFNPYPTNDRAADRLLVASATQLVTLTALGQQQLQLCDNANITTVDNGATVPGSGVYVCFGLGKRCSLLGQGSANAPVNFFDKFSLDPSPSASYARYGVVFQVSGINSTSNAPAATGSTIIDFARAKFVKVFRFGSSLTTGDDAIKSYWDDVSTTGGS